MQDEHTADPRAALTFAPDYGVDIPVWDDRVGYLSVEELAALGVSAGLIEKMRAWQLDWEHDPRKTWNYRDQVVASVPLRVRLARQLQAELRDHRVFLEGARGRVPVEDWPG